MNKNTICMLIYFLAAGCLFGFAFSSNSLFLYLGIAFLAGALIYSKMIKK